MRKFRLFLMLIAFPLQAQLNIDITQGMVGGIPIAVVAHLQHESASFEALAKVICQDLKMSGRFEPLPSSQLPSFTAKQAMQVSLWRKLGVENVLLGEVRLVGVNRYNISFKLLEVYKSAQSQGEAAQPVTLVTKAYHGIPHQDFRNIAHQISDIVYAQLTGIKGVFSTRMAYVIKEGPTEQYRLTVADIDGLNAVTLVKSLDPILSPAWSPDGRQLLFATFEQHRAKIYRIEVATGERQLLSELPGINGAPAWSPDGKKVALVLSWQSSPKIYLMDLSSRKLTQLTTGQAIDTEPAWSPDGRALFFTSNRGGKPQIYCLDLVTKGVERVTFVGGYNARPVVTPDGKHIVMMHRPEQSEVFHIASQVLATGEVSLLTHSSFDESPTLSPNGEMVLYAKQGERSLLGLVTLDGRVQMNLLVQEGSGNIQEPAWSPFLG